VLSLAVASLASQSKADITTVSVSGTFDSTWATDTGTNVLNALVGQSYSMSFSFGNWSANYRTDLHLTDGTPDMATYFFFMNDSLSMPDAPLFNYSVPGGPVLAAMNNDSLGGDEPYPGFPTPYDRLNLVGWNYNWNGYVGYNAVIEFQIFGTTGFLNGIGKGDLGNIDWSQVTYGTTDLRLYHGSTLIGDVGQDPPLHFEDGTFYTDDGSMGGGITVTPVPEPSTWAMLIFGFGSLGAVFRNRRRLALAA
jgi:hypothetical protein